MRITPLDVRKQEFRRAMRGLDPEEVYAFLTTVADEYEAALNDNKALRERLLELDDKVQEYRTMEKTLRDTLMTAERVNAEAKDNARREAEIIIKEAQLEAEKSLRDIKGDAMRLRQQIQNLRSQRDSFLARMRVVAESHLKYIESATSDLDTDEDAGEEPRTEKRPGNERRPSNLFDAPRPRPIPSPSPASPVRPASPPPMSAGETPAPQVGGKAPTMPRSPGGPTASRDADPISAIIDRMKRSQQETLSTGAGTPGYEASGSATGIEVQAPPAAPEKVEEPVEELADPAPSEGNDVTSELDAETIRRELAQHPRDRR